MFRLDAGRARLVDDNYSVIHYSEPTLLPALYACAGYATARNPESAS